MFLSLQLKNFIKIKIVGIIVKKIGVRYFLSRAYMLLSCSFALAETRIKCYLNKRNRNLL